MATPTAFFEGQFVPLEQANINIMTHAFNYGTAVFEGVRGNWNADQGELYLFKIRDHVRRIRQSAKIMRMGLKYSDDEICDILAARVRGIVAEPLDTIKSRSGAVHGHSGTAVSVMIDAMPTVA